MEKKSGIFYGWIIVVMCCFQLLAVVGIGNNCWSVFTIPMCEGLNMTRAQFSSFFTINTCSQIVTFLFINKLYDKFGQLNVMRAAAIMFPLSLIGISRVTGPLGFYIFGCINGFCFVSSSFFALTIVIGNWFDHKRGTAMGIVFMSSPFGAMLMIPLVTRWIERLSWRTALVIMAAMMAAITIPITWFFLKIKPQDMGLLPLTDPNKSKASEDHKPTLDPDLEWGFTRKEFLLLASGWLYLLSQTGMHLAGSCSNTIVPYLQDIGFTAEGAAAVHSIGMGTIALGRLLAGRFTDKFGVMKVMKFCYLLSPLVLIGLILMPYSRLAIVIMMIGYTLSQVPGAVCNPIAMGRLFGRKHYAAIYGLFSSISSSLGAVTPLIYGAVYNSKGSYLPTYKGFLIGSISAYFTLSLCIKMQTKVRAEKLTELGLKADD